MIPTYIINLSEWDKSNGLGPQLLTQAKHRAILLARENQDPNRDQLTTQFYRGVYSEVLSLIDLLEKAGVSHAP